VILGCLTAEVKIPSQREAPQKQKHNKESVENTTTTRRRNCLAGEERKVNCKCSGDWASDSQWHPHPSFVAAISSKNFVKLKTSR